jgi:hypothetical protein
MSIIKAQFQVTKIHILKCETGRDIFLLFFLQLSIAHIRNRARIIYIHMCTGVHIIYMVLLWETECNWNIHLHLSHTYVFALASRNNKPKNKIQTIIRISQTNLQLHSLLQLLNKFPTIVFYERLYSFEM